MSNRITLQAAIELLRKSTPLPLITLDEIGLSDEDDVDENKLSVWIDGYLVAKSKGMLVGGEIYSRFYVDLEVDRNGEVSIDFDTGSYDIRTENLEVFDGEKNISEHLEHYDEINVVLGKYLPDENMAAEDLEQLKEDFKAMLEAKLGGKITIDAIKNHRGFQSANTLPSHDKPQGVAPLNHYLVRTDHTIDIHAKNSVGFNRHYHVLASTAEQATIIINKMVLSQILDSEFVDYPEHFFTSLHNFDWVEAEDEALSPEQIEVKRLLQAYIEKHGALPIDDDYGVIVDKYHTVYTSDAVLLTDREYENISQHLDFQPVEMGV